MLRPFGAEASGVSHPVFGGERSLPPAKGPRENQVQFAVNGNEYFLSFVPEEGGWFVFTPTAEGVQRVPVVHDDEVPIGSPVVIIPEHEGSKTIN
jgi:hypothetical protein